MKKWFAALLVVGWSSSAFGQSTPFYGAPLTLPGTVEAEDFDNGGNRIAYFDTTDGNQLLGDHRPGESVDIQVATEHDFNVGKIRATEWLNYSVNVLATGTYTISARVASLGPGGTFHIEFNNVDVTGPITVPDTGDWQTWATRSKTVTLTAGTQVMRFVVNDAGPSGALGNLNYFTIATALPGTVEAENFDNGLEMDAYHDTTADNQLGAYRNTGVDIEQWSSTGYNVGKTRVGEWLKYSVDVSAPGSYTLTARVASLGLGGTFHVEFDDVNVTGAMSIPNTGDWHAWQLATAPVTLTSGPHSMKVVMDGVGDTTAIGNFDYFTLTPDNPTFEQITVVQWNVHKGREECANADHSTCGPTYQEIAAYLDTVVHADVVSMNEVAYLRGNYGDEPYEFEHALEVQTGQCWDRYYVAANAPDSNLGNLLLWRSKDDLSCGQAPGRFQKQDVFSRALTSQSTDEARAVAGVKLLIGTHEVAFFSTHLCAPGVCTNRQQQVTELKTAVADFAGAAPRVVAGDFNANPTDSEISNPTNGMTTNYIDLWREAYDAGTASPNNLGEPTHGTSRFDYIFRPNDGTLSLVRARIDHPTNPLNGWSFSDHAPLTVTLTIR